MRRSVSEPTIELIANWMSSVGPMRGRCGRLLVRFQQWQQGPRGFIWNPAKTFEDCSRV